MQFQTDSVGTLRKLIEVQRTAPISLDPLLDHALSHGAMQVFGVGAFAARLPALAGFLMMQVCLFFFVRNLAGERAGAVAAAFPAMTATLYYSAEGRPYGLMLGLYALALLCWQVAGKQWSVISGQWSEKASARGWALVGLAVAIAATINAHYFGVLLLAPICAAEAWRTLARRRIDWPTCGAIAVGMLGWLGTMPFLPAASEFRRNYYNGGTGGAARYYAGVPVDVCRLHADERGGAACVDGCAGGVCRGAGVGMRAGAAHCGRRRSGCCCWCWRRMPFSAMCWRGW